MNPLDILDFVNGFYGYGNPEAPLWFVGYEERGVQAERAARINQWVMQQPPRQFLDVHAYHAGLGLMGNLGPAAKYQRTWGQLSRLAVAALGNPAATLAEVKHYQGAFLGRAKGDTLLTELFPLPNPSVKDWIWADQTCQQLPFLIHRATYQEDVVETRAKELNRLIRERVGPVVAVAYGLAKYRDVLFGTNWNNSALVDNIEYCWKNVGQTLVVSCAHPNRRGVTNRYFSEIGTFVRDRLIAAQRGGWRG